MFKTYEHNKDDYRDKVMTDFMDTALTYQAGIRIAPNSKWVMTNGTIQMDVCDVCRQPIYEGHIDCTCDKNHATHCERPTYDKLKAQHDALAEALETAYDQLPCVCGDNFETCDCAVAKVTAALSEQVK
jgi:hypothetical protein